MASPAIDTGLSLKVTIHAGLHMENACRANSLHTFDLPVAGLASHIGRYVPLMAKVNKIRQIIDLDPWDRLFCIPIMDKLLDLYFLFRDIFMTADAKLHGWYTCDDRFARIGMTIGAVDFVVACVDLVAKINWLNRCGVRTVYK